MFGKLYWGRKEEEGKKAEGIVVLFAWLSSQEKHVRPYVDLYWSLGWGCLVCHVDFLTLFFPEKASTLARRVLDELIKEVKVQPLPIVLASFSGGSKGCLYKVLQLVEGKFQGKNSLQVDYRPVGECLSGQMYDSSPTDFTSDVGLRFVLHPSVLRLSHPPKVLTWMAKGFASGLDALFINRFEADRADYWQTLYSSVSVGPFLLLCSKDDELVPYKIVWGFAKRLQELGGDVNLIKWSSSPHVGSEIQSKNKFMFGSIEMHIKLVSGNSAGTVTSFYISSTGDHQDRIDFEFLGNLSGQPYTIRTNVFVNGIGQREQQFYPWFDPTADFHNYTIHWNPSQIVWFVDGMPIRVFRNLAKMGIPYPNSQAMKVYSSLWNAANGATRDGLVKIDWNSSPFMARYRGLKLDACYWYGPGSNQYCAWNAPGNWWASPEYSKLSYSQIGQLKWVRKNYMLYDYCKDVFRFHGKMPLECYQPLL